MLQTKWGTLISAGEQTMVSEMILLWGHIGKHCSGFLIVQSSAIIMQSNITGFSIWYDYDWGKYALEVIFTKDTLISRPHGQAMGCFCEDLGKNWSHYNSTHCSFMIQILKILYCSYIWKLSSHGTGKTMTWLDYLNQSQNQMNFHKLSNMSSLTNYLWNGSLLTNNMKIQQMFRNDKHFFLFWI